MNQIRDAVNAIPKPVRDFVEGCAAVMVTGAADQVLALNLGIATPKLILAAAIVGAMNAAISYARRRGLQPVTTPATPQ